MEENAQNINNKEKQSVGGNWGHPRKYIKKHTKLPDPLISLGTINYGLRKRKKREKKEFVSKFETCPFCQNKLSMTEGTKNSNGYLLWWVHTEKWCRKCGASQIPECPACKKPTWLNKGGLYKHPYMGCGFEGEKKEDGCKK